MTKQIALIGQSDIWRYKNGQKALSETIEKEIKNGYTHFIMALATDFDLVAYDTCIALRKTYPDLKITVVINDYKYYACKIKNYSNLMCVNYIYYPLQKPNPNKSIVANDKYVVSSSDKIICFYNDQIFNMLQKRFSRANNPTKNIVNAFELLNDIF